MAITNNGTAHNLSANEKPSGYSDPSIITFDDWESVSTRTLTVLKATVENATAATTMANIFNDVTIGLDKQIEDIVAADYLASATVTTWAELTNLTHNLAAINGAGDYLKATAISYVCTVKYYVKTS